MNKKIVVTFSFPPGVAVPAGLTLRPAKPGLAPRALAEMIHREGAVLMMPEIVVH